MAKPRVVIVEDERAIRDNIQFALESEGLETTQLSVGSGLAPLLERGEVDLVVLDVGLPDVNGFDLVREIRRTHSTPIILLTARNAELDRVVGLEIGADDYMTKPFSPRELAARVKAVLRRTQGSPEPRVASAPTPAPAGFVVSMEKRSISYRGSALTLSKYEFEILSILIARPGHVFTREALMNRIWEEPAQSLDRTVDAHIKNLRAKLRAVDPDVDPIVTHRGTGYSLREDA